MKRLYPYEGDTHIDFKVKCEKIKIPRGGIRFYGKRHRKCFVCNIMYRLFSDSQFVIDRDISVSAYCCSSIDYVTLLSDNTLLLVLLPFDYRFVHFHPYWLHMERCMFSSR